MPAAAEDLADSVSAGVGRRWRAIDPLLPVPRTPSAGCGAALAVAGADGEPAAIGTCQHWTGTPGSLELTWGAARRFQLTARVTGQDVAGNLDQLLALWRDHVATVPGTGDEDTAAVVHWPSRDIDGVQALLSRGLKPLAVLAARPATPESGRPADAVPRATDTASRQAGAASQEAGGVAPGADGGSGMALGGARIRRAGPADVDAVARLGLEVVRFDAHFGGVMERPETPAAMRGEAAELLTRSRVWTWLAERDGAAIGLLAAEPPESAGWIAPMAGLPSAAYLMLMVVAPGERGSGVGAALTGQFHHEIDAARVPVTLLHYALLNPLSAPFWSQQGYRPLWTSWEARPARTLR